MNIHDEIKKLLDAGTPVFSCAAGRVGEILNIDDHPSGFVVNICPKSRSHSPVTVHRHRHGATRFDRGDAVELVQRDGIWMVVNIL